MARELVDLSIEEISLVDSPANPEALVMFFKREESVSNVLTFMKGSAPPPGSRQALEGEIDRRVEKLMGSRPGMSRRDALVTLMRDPAMDDLYRRYTKARPAVELEEPAPEPPVARKVRERAEGLVMKTAGKMSLAQAIAKVLTTDEGLYREYLGESRRGAPDA